MTRAQRVATTLLTVLLWVGVAEGQAVDRKAAAAAWQAEALAEHADALAAPEMIDRMLAVKALGALARDANLRNQADVRALLEVAARDVDENVARQAQVLLARLDGVDLIPADVRSAHRLEMQRDALAEHAAALAAEEMIDRLQAVKSLATLGRFGDADGREIRALLQAAMADSDPNVAHQAAVALADLAGDDVITADVRTAHRLSMERDQVDEVEVALRASDMMERMTAVKSLAALVDDAMEAERVVSLLDAATGDPEPNVAAQAQLALRRWRARQPEAP